MVIQCLLHQGLHHRFQIISMITQRVQQSLVIDVFMDTVGGQQEVVTGLDVHHFQIHVQVQVDSQGPRQVTLGGGNAGGMVPGHLLQRTIAHPPDPGIPHVEDIGGTGLQNHAAEGGDIAFFRLQVTLPLPEQPAIQRGQYLVSRLLDAPGVRGGIVVVDEAGDGDFGGFPPGLGGADPIGNGGDDALTVQQRTMGDLDGHAVFVLRFHSGAAELGRAYRQLLPGFFQSHCVDDAKLKG